MYSQILYNSMFFGYEAAQTCRGCDAEGMAGALADGVAEAVAEALTQQNTAGYGGLADEPLPPPPHAPVQPTAMMPPSRVAAYPSVPAPPPAGPEVLTPIGNIQIAAKELVAQQPDLGAMLTNCAVVFDFFAGFAPPRHLYTGEIYRAWGNLPFESDDFWAHGVLDLLYPGYEDSSYFTSERGFQVETPFGDATDVFLSDAPGYILNRYPVLIIASRLRSMRKETAAKLVAYVESGGTLVMTADASEALGQPLFGAAVPSMDPLLCKTVPANTTVTVKGATPAWSQPEPHVWRLCPVVCQSTACTSIATIDGATAAVEVSAGKGKLLLLGSSGVAAVPAVALPISSNVGAGLPNPYPMLQHCKFLLGERLAAQTPFTAHVAAPGPLPFAAVGNDLSVITTHVAKGKYVIGLANNALTAQPFKLRANPAMGAITAITEIQLLDGADGPHPVTPATPGYKPNGHWNVSVGKSTNTSIAGLDVRLFAVDVQEAAEDIATPSMPLAPRLRALPLPELGTTGGASMMDSILLRPTFFDHFDTVVVDWRYIASRTPAALAEEGRWAYRQSLSTVVDFTSGMNLYPDFRLCNNSADDYARSIATIEGVLSKMATLVNATTATEAKATYSSHAIISLHRGVENGYSGAQVAADFVTSMRHLTAFASAKHVTLHLRLGAPGKPPGSITGALQFLRSVNSSSANLKIAVSTAVLVSTNTTASEVHDLAKANKLGMLLASAPVIDPLTKQVISNYGPLAGCLDQQFAGGACGTATAAILAQASSSNQSVLVVVDAALPQALEPHQDAFFLESKALAAIAALPFPPPPPSPPLPCELSRAAQCVMPAAPVAGSCYTLGTELCGLCEITSDVPSWHILMQCGTGPNPNTVIADYAVGGGWAGQYGNHFGGLLAQDVGCTKVRLEYSDRWNITLTYAGQERSWALAPQGYLPPENVSRITCGPKVACKAGTAAADHLPPALQVDYECVSAGQT